MQLGPFFRMVVALPLHLRAHYFSHGPRGYVQLGPLFLSVSIGGLTSVMSDDIAHAPPPLLPRSPHIRQMRMTFTSLEFQVVFISPLYMHSSPTWMWWSSFTSAIAFHTNEYLMLMKVKFRVVRMSNSIPSLHLVYPTCPTHHIEASNTLEKKILV